MSIISLIDTLPVKPMRWAARLVSIPWALWALLGAWFVVAHFTEEGNPLSLAVSAAIIIVLALMFVGAAFIASVWGREAIGGWVLIADGVLIFASIIGFVYVAGTPEEFARFIFGWLSAAAFFTTVFPPLVAGSLFLVSAHVTATPSAGPHVAEAEVAETEAAAEEPDRPEARKVSTRKRIAIALLLMSPIVIFALEVLYPRSKTAPPQALVGRWEAEPKLRVGRLPVSFTLHEDGTVEGTVGDAAMQDAYFKRNRGWLFRMLPFATEYIIKGDLKGPLTGDFQCARFWIVGQFDENGIRADFDCSVCQKDGKKEAPLGTIVGAYTRVKQP